MRRLVERRGAGYDSLRDVWLRTDLPLSTLERLADADAFRSIGLDRRAALWAARGLGRTGDSDTLAPVRGRRPRARAGAGRGAAAHGPARRARGQRLPLPVALPEGAPPSPSCAAVSTRPAWVPADRLAVLATGRSGGGRASCWCASARARPRAVIFMTVEDETGVANLIVWPKVFERLRGVVHRRPPRPGPRPPAAGGRRRPCGGGRGGRRDAPSRPAFSRLRRPRRPPRADEVRRPVAEGRDDKPRPRLVHLIRENPDVAADLKRLAAESGRVMPKGRNFH